MRRVLVYAPRVLPDTQTFVADQARGLRRWEPVVVGRQREGTNIPIDDLLAPAFAGHDIHGVLAQRATRRVPALREEVRRRPPDLIHAHFLTGGLDVVASLRPLETPLVVSAHGFDATVYGTPPSTLLPHRWIYGARRRRLLQHPARFLAVSAFIRDQLIDLGAPPAAVTVHHTGVDVDYFTPGRSKRSGLLFVGRLVEKKGLHHLLRALARLRPEGTEHTLVVIGDGPERARLQRLASEARLPVDFRGVQDRAAVRDAMRSALLLCGPSTTAQDGDREGFGMVFAEAQACGLPVVATNSGGIPDAVADGETGFLVPEGDDRALAAALRRLIDDPELRRRFSRCARERARREFDLVRQCARLERIYDESVAAASMPGRGSL